MTDEEVSIGRVGRPHGVDGAFVVEQASDDPQRFEPGAALLAAGEPATVVLSRQVGGRRRAIKLDRPVDRGAELTIRRSDLPPAAPDHYYVFELVGLEVLDTEGQRVGVVSELLPGVANDSLVLDNRRLVPMVEDCVREIDVDARRIVVAGEFVTDG